MKKMRKIRKKYQLTDNKDKIGNKTHKIISVIKTSNKYRMRISKCRMRKNRKKYKKNDINFKLRLPQI